MQPAELIRLQPTLPMIAGELEASGWRCEAAAAGTQRGYRGVRMFSGQHSPEPDLLYIITAENAEQFPRDGCAYLCGEPIPGRADHICCPQRSPAEILERLLDLFQRCQDQERRLDQMALADAGLDELCRWAHDLTGSPVCIHDGWFIVLAVSGDLPEPMRPECVAASSKRFIPRKFIDAFMAEGDGPRDWEQGKAERWVSDPALGSVSCIRANLWDGDVCRGRVLIPETDRPLRPLHYLAAECLAQRAALLLRRRGGAGDYHSMDGAVRALLEGQPAADTAVLLERLGWSREDRYLCVRLQSRQSDGAAMAENLLHGDLFRSFPTGYVMFMERQQCVLLNMCADGRTVLAVRRALEPLCRDYRLYAGISSPARGIDELKYAFLQADIALKTAFSRRNERWAVPFSACALDHILQSLKAGLPPGRLAAPELQVLLDHDQRKGTRYFATLCAFLRSERDVPRTSKAMSIHRSTLIYRLDHIRDMTGIDLDDPDQRLYLQLSLKLLEQSGVRIEKKHISQNTEE